MFASIFKRLAGRHYRKFLESARPVVARINEVEITYQALTDEQLRAKTEEFRARVKGGETLDAILPEAFAAVKNAARRLVGQSRQTEVHALCIDNVGYCRIALLILARR